MRFLEIILLKATLWLLPIPATVGQATTTVGDYTLETSAKLYMIALRRLASIEEYEGR